MDFILDQISAVIAFVKRHAAVILLIAVVGIVSALGYEQYRKFTNPPLSITGVIRLQGIQALAELSTVKHNYSSIVNSAREMPAVLNFLYGESQSMVAVGHIRAGVDLGLLQEEDIIRTPDSLTIHLPPPTLQDCYLSEKDSYVVSRSTGLFVSASPELDASGRSFAIEQFRMSALDSGILEEANLNAVHVLQEFLTMSIELTGQDVEINIIPSDPDLSASLPNTCR
jgi:hypothetical protein